MLEFLSKIIKTGASALGSSFYPAQSPAANVMIAKLEGVKAAADTKTNFKLAFDWTNQADILATQLEEGATIHLGLMLGNVNAGSFTISNVKLYV